MKGVMQQLGALDLATGPNPLHLPSNPTQTLVPYSGVPSSAAQSDSASTQQPAVATAGSTAEPQAFAAVGWGLSIFSYAEEVWVKGQVLSWNVRQGQHHVLYEDGEDEWLKLGKEHVQWHSHKCDIAQRAGLQNGVCTALTVLLMQLYINKSYRFVHAAVALHAIPMASCQACCTTVYHANEAASRSDHLNS